MAIKVFDKAKWHIDNGEGRYEVLAKFHEVLSFLKKHNMLSTDGLEMYELGVDTSFSLHEKMLTPEGIDFLNNYYDDVINCSPRTIAKELERRLDKGGKKFYKNESVVLTESDADAFLESVGVELFEDSIAINGTLYEGTYGEEILEENGIFLYEDGIVLEGEYADFATKAIARGKAFAQKSVKAVNDHRNKKLDKRMDDLNKRRDAAVAKIQDMHSRAHKNDDFLKTAKRIADKGGDEFFARKAKQIERAHDKADAFAQKSMKRVEKSYNRQKYKIDSKRPRAEGYKNESTIFSDIDII